MAGAGGPGGTVVGGAARAGGATVEAGVGGAAEDGGAGTATVPTWVARLLARSGSGVGADTTATLVMLAPAVDAATATTSVTVRLSRMASVPVFVQVTVVFAAVHDHPGPEAER